MNKPIFIVMLSICLIIVAILLTLSVNGKYSNETFISTQSSINSNDKLTPTKETKTLSCLEKMSPSDWSECQSHDIGKIWHSKVCTDKSSVECRYAIENIKENARVKCTVDALPVKDACSLVGGNQYHTTGLDINYAILPIACAGQCEVSNGDMCNPSALSHHTSSINQANDAWYNCTAHPIYRVIECDSSCKDNDIESCQSCLDDLNPTPFNGNCILKQKTLTKDSCIVDKNNTWPYSIIPDWDYQFVPTACRDDCSLVIDTGGEV